MVLPIEEATAQQHLRDLLRDLALIAGVVVTCAGGDPRHQALHLERG